MGKHERLSAQRAYDLGLVSEIVPGDALDGTGVGDRLDREPATHRSRCAGTRLAIRKSFSLPTYEAELLGENYRMKSAVTEDAQEGARAFLEKRDPDLEGASTHRRPSVVRAEGTLCSVGCPFRLEVTACPSPTTSTSRTRPSTTARSPGSCSTGPRAAQRPEPRRCSSSSTTRSCAAEADDTVRVVILGGAGPMFSSGHDMGSKEAMRGACPGPTSTRRATINGGTRKGAEKPMLQEWHYFFENTQRWRNLRKITIAQVHGDGVRRRADADVGVRPDRRAPTARVFADVVGTRLGMCGVEYFAHPWEFGPRKTKELMLTGDSHRRRRGAPARHGEQGLPARRARRPHARVRPPHRRAAHDDRAADQGVGEPDASTTWASTTRSTPASRCTSSTTRTGPRSTTTAWPVAKLGEDVPDWRGTKLKLAERDTVEAAVEHERRPAARAARGGRAPDPQPAREAQRAQQGAAHRAGRHLRRARDRRRGQRRSCSPAPATARSARAWTWPSSSSGGGGGQHGRRADADADDVVPADATRSSRGTTRSRSSPRSTARPSAAASRSCCAATSWSRPST